MSDFSSRLQPVQDEVAHDWQDTAKNHSLPPINRDDRRMGPILFLLLNRLIFILLLHKNIYSNSLMVTALYNQIYIS